MRSMRYPELTPGGKCGIFDQADVSDVQDGFSDYDEIVQLPVAITNMEIRIVYM